MSFYRFLMRAMGFDDHPPAAPAMAQLTIISTEPVKRSSGTRSR